MPQMAPMSWLTLYIFFAVIFMMFNFMNYYMFMINPSSQTTNKKMSKKSFNWKW
uniref:ATP synthase complex subunit 8 n=1 Tax=Colymbetes fuscus TaxID=1509382 RepID=A0A191ZR68_9DYTI|nr:ATP synthase F0 subunit 8 [Colymbetes fuscus]